MRTLPQYALVALALALSACGRDDRRPAAPAAGATQSAQPRGPDALILRLPRAGGVARVTAYGKPDSAVWTSPVRVPALQRVLAFDDDGGTIAFVDKQGRAGWIDLREATVTFASRERVVAPVARAGEIFGVGDGGAVTRYAATGAWTVRPPRPARSVFPQPDGSIVVLAGRASAATAWRIRPPDEEPRDTVALPVVDRTLHTQLGDVLYLVSDESLIPLRTRTFEAQEPIELDHRVIAMVATPSGDRLFALADSSRDLLMVDRFREAVSTIAELPALGAELRMDPLGRYLLVRHADRDSAWVVALGTGRIIGALATAWRDDLPFVASDGAVATVSGNDVVFVDAETLRERQRVAGGAADFWYAFVWSGFRPRAPGLDVPVRFPGVETSPDSAPADSLPVGPPAPEPAPAPAPAQPAATVTLVQFGAFANEASARALSERVRVDGQAARVVTTSRDGTPIYRVVIGPFRSRDEAERIGRASGRDYVLYDTEP